MTDLVMFDAVNAYDIPADAKAVAGYVDGRYISFPEVVKRFWPHAECISIGIYIDSLAAFADVEPGNPIQTPAQVRTSFEFRKHHGVYRPGFYADQTRMREAVLPGLVGIPRSEYRLWVADWTGHPHIPAGYDACQFKSTSGYDESLTAPSFWRHDLKPPRRTVTHRKRTLKKVTLPAPVHRKVKAATGGGGGGVGLVTLLTHAGVHLTSAESASVATVLALIAAWLTPAKP